MQLKQIFRLTDSDEEKRMRLSEQRTRDAQMRVYLVCQFIVSRQNAPFPMISDRAEKQIKRKPLEHNPLSFASAERMLINT